MDAFRDATKVITRQSGQLLEFLFSHLTFAQCPLSDHMGAFRAAVDLVVARATGEGDSAIWASAALEVGVAQ
jgi:hypothetical protein